MERGSQGLQRSARWGLFLQSGHLPAQTSPASRSLASKVLCMIQNSAFLWLTHTALYMGLTSLVAGIKQHKCSGFKSLIIPFVFFSSLSSVYFFVGGGGVFLIEQNWTWSFLAFRADESVFRFIFMKCTAQSLWAIKHQCTLSSSSSKAFRKKRTARKCHIQIKIDNYVFPVWNIFVILVIRYAVKSTMHTKHLYTILHWPKERYQKSPKWIL